MIEIDTSSPVLVTGATGYVAGWIIKYLLEAGVTVHAAVRDPSNADKLKHLNDLAKRSSGSIQYYKTNLLEPGSYQSAMQDCSIVLHTASPFSIHVKDPQKDLIDPALLGTRNVLSQATNTASVKRVVVTSSCAAIYGDNIDLKELPNGLLTEAVWNTSSSLSHNPYSYSKTIAEQEAWKISKTQQQWSLVTINPSLVMGPGLEPNATSESFKIIKQMGDGTMKMGVADLPFGVVDVRDVANAHIAAAFSQHAQGRYIVCGHNTSLFKVAKQLQTKYAKDYPIPKKVLPKPLVWLFGPIMNPGLTRRYISRNVGYAWQADNTKGIHDLQLKYRPLKETMNEFFQQMIDAGKF